MDKILIVEDDSAIAMGLEYSLQQEGFLACVAGSVKEALAALEKDSFVLALLDLTLPDGTGYEVCRKIKNDPRLENTPVLFLTACDEEVNVVMGLDMGADDYITKPFRIRELISRIKSVLRRSAHDSQTQLLITIQDLTINTVQARVFRQNQEVFLTALEYRLLLLFATHPNQVLTRDALFEGIWDIAGNFVNDNTLTVYIKRLREKLLDDMVNPQIIKTVRGLGYKMEKL